jgi:hypothetical protein
MSMKVAMVIVAAGMAMAGCSRSPMQPDSSGAAPSSLSSASESSARLQAKPGYEPAYYNGTTVTINAIEVPQNKGPLENAAAEFYQVVYPTDHTL